MLRYRVVLTDLNGMKFTCIGLAKPNSHVHAVSMNRICGIGELRRRCEVNQDNVPRDIIRSQKALVVRNMTRVSSLSAAMGKSGGVAQCKILHREAHGKHGQTARILVRPCQWSLELALNSSVFISCYSGCLETSSRMVISILLPYHFPKVDLLWKDFLDYILGFVA